MNSYQVQDFAAIDRSNTLRSLHFLDWRPND